MARISAIYIWHMRFILAITILFAAPVFGQSGEWDPTPYNAAGIRFHDNLDFFLTSYTKPEIKVILAGCRPTSSCAHRLLCAT
jgi:hypothetical protein